MNVAWEEVDNDDHNDDDDDNDDCNKEAQTSKMERF